MGGSNQWEESMDAVGGTKRWEEPMGELCLWEEPSEGSNQWEESVGKVGWTLKGRNQLEEWEDPNYGRSRCRD